MLSQLFVMLLLLSSPSRTVFGIELDAEFEVARCTHNGQNYVPIEKETYWPCRMHIGGTTGPGMPFGKDQRIGIRIDNLPVGFEGGAIVGNLIGGKLQSLFIKTSGLESQADVYAILLEKYGVATESEVTSFKNLMGAEAEVIIARWRFDDLLIDFSGVSKTVSEGYIYVRTPAGDKAESAEVDLQRDSKRKM